MTHYLSLIRNICMLAACSGLFLATHTSHAKENPSVIAEIQAIALTDGYAKALSYLNKSIDQNPTLRVEMLSLKAALLASNQQLNEAAKIYTTLIQDKPQLLAAYNNLAVVYANQGRLDLAESTLNQGINSHPELAVLYQNMLSIKGQQASIALQMALNPSVQLNASTQLAKVERINTIDIAVPQQSVAVATETAVTLEPMTVTVAPPTQELVARAANTVQPPSLPLPAPARAPRPNATAEPQPQPTTAPAQPAPPAASATALDNKRIEDFVQNWAKAWTAGDADRYLAFYSSQFKPSGRLTYADWLAQRRQRVTPRANIRVEVDNIRITPSSQNQVIVAFRQSYRSNALSSRSQKSLVLSFENGAWLVVGETIN